MSYYYKPKKNEEIENIARAILDAFQHRRIGLAVDIEGILEDLGLDLLPRQGLRKYADGYLASDPRIIVIDESILSYMPRARFTIAEEVCHLILEYKFWKGGAIPEGARCHELSEKQHFFVEKDAKSLAAHLLMPKEDFRVVFDAKLRDLLSLGLSGKGALKVTFEHLGRQFEVSPSATFWHAVNLRLIDKNGQIR